MHRKLQNIKHNLTVPLKIILILPTQKMVLKICFIFFLLISLCSCFEVIEEINFNKNGSGVFKLSLNLSQSKNEINTLMRLDSSSGYHIPKVNDINASFNQAIVTLKKTEGLSNITIKRDFKNWIFELKTEFKSTKNLETGLKNIYADFLDDESKAPKNKLGFDGKLAKRESAPLEAATRKRMNNPTEKRILTKAKYTTIYHFENQISSYTNKRAKVSPSKKAIMLQSSLLNIINQKETIENQIKLYVP